MTHLLVTVKTVRTLGTYYYYNTDVVFDRNGTIISRFVYLIRRTNNLFVDFRYHKYNLFGEFDMDRPDEPEIETFETDFGVKFGIFTCFDILFKSPAQTVLNENIDAIVYPTNWHSELPFLTGLFLTVRHELFLKPSLRLFKVSRCTLTPTK